jgi:peptidoglycan/xylan/chitin deacetylase (PgdA/CDA1 family)
MLKSWDAKATFFITGNNIGKGQIDNAALPWPNLIKRMYNEGHQIASHTWSHQDLSSLTQQQRLQQMHSLEMALRNILGLFPTYMRPPYSSCTGQCQTDMADLGYHVTYFDLDTEDYLNDAPSMIQKPKNNFQGNLTSRAPSAGDWLVIGHDIHEQTAHNLTQFMLETARRRQYRAVTVGECLGDPSENWYRSADGGILTSSATRPGPPPAPPTSNPSSAAGPPGGEPTGVSVEGNCAGTTGRSCLGSTFGNCCSVNGWW